VKTCDRARHLSACIFSSVRLFLFAEVEFQVKIVKDEDDLWNRLGEQVRYRKNSRKVVINLLCKGDILRKKRVKKIRFKNQKVYYFWGEPCREIGEIVILFNLAKMASAEQSKAREAKLCVKIYQILIFYGKHRTYAIGMLLLKSCFRESRMKFWLLYLQEVTHTETYPWYVISHKNEKNYIFDDLEPMHSHISSKQLFKIVFLSFSL